jgi:hypothetical protein
MSLHAPLGTDTARRLSVAHLTGLGLHRRPPIAPKPRKALAVKPQLRRTASRALSAASVAAIGALVGRGNVAIAPPPAASWDVTLHVAAHGPAALPQKQRSSVATTWDAALRKTARR